NNQIRALAGSSTRSLDLKGRMVSPGLAATHDHPQDWDPINPYLIKKVITDDVHIERFLWEGPPAEKIAALPRTLEEAVRAAKPGQWVRVSILNGRDYSGHEEVTASFGRQVTKQMLDLMAPNNPVEIRAGFVGLMLNQKAIDAVKQWYGDEWDQFIAPPLGASLQRTGVGGTDYRYVEQDVLYPLAKLTELYQLGTSWWAGYGLAINASNVYTGGAMSAYTTIDRNNQMKIRLPWTWYWPQRKDFFLDPYFAAAAVAMEGKGSDYLFMTGSNPAGNTNACSSLPGTSPEVKQGEPECRFFPDSPPGQMSRNAFLNLIRRGGRFAGAHTIGDKDIDYIMDMIEQGSKEAGLNADQIRQRRHTWDHLAMNPRPDQIPRLKNLGFILGGWDIAIWEGDGKQVMKDYGEQATQWIIPRKALLDAGVRQSIEIDRPLGYTDLTFFHVLHMAITRKDRDGTTVISPQQRVSREVILKSATLSGAYYARKEDKMGSLEPGKFADLIVLDRDYLTIPEDDIPNIRVLMTLLGGQVTHLVPSLAREFGMQPAGAQVELGGNPAKW
ncbi:MAG: amidohydrolase family protein, partial [Acidobacteria bacterium]|nr:amidohydrolase family protein [Acidobacteriota bacterium]